MLLTATPPRISDNLIMKMAHRENDCYVFNPYPVGEDRLGRNIQAVQEGFHLITFKSM